MWLKRKHSIENIGVKSPVYRSCKGSLGAGSQEITGGGSDVTLEHEMDMWAQW